VVVLPLSYKAKMRNIFENYERFIKLVLKPLTSFSVRGIFTYAAKKDG